MKRKWSQNFLYLGITLFLVGVCSISFLWLLMTWSGFKSTIGIILAALTPFIYGIAIAYILDKIMVLFENYVFDRLGKKIYKENGRKARVFSRTMSIVVSQLLAWAFIAGLLAIVLPQVYHSIQNLVLRSSLYLDSIVGWVEETVQNHPRLEETLTALVGNVSDALMNWVKTTLMPQMSNVITNITGGVLSLLTVLFNVALGVIISIYLMFNKEIFIAQGKKMIYAMFKTRWANRIMYELGFIHRAFGNFISGKIVDSIIIGAIAYVVLSLLKMPYAALVSLIIGLTNIIPLFGPFIGAIPCGLIILLESPTQCVIFIIFIIILQQFDGNILGPKILGAASGLSGFWIMFAILFFGKLFGFPGMLFGVPIFTVIYNGAKRYNRNRLRARELPLETSTYIKIDQIDPETKMITYQADADDLIKKQAAKWKNMQEKKKEKKLSGSGAGQVRSPSPLPDTERRDAGSAEAGPEQNAENKK